MNARKDSQAQPADLVAAPNGAALAIVGESARQEIAGELEHVGFACVFATEPYEAMLELSRRPLAFRAMLLSLAAVYPAELAMIQTVRERFPHVEVILADAHGRSAAMAAAIRFGAQALLDEGRLHRISGSGRPAGDLEQPVQAAAGGHPRLAPAVLTNEELRALLEGF